MNFVGSAKPLTQTGFSAAVDSIGIKAAEMWAVLSVETSGCGFLSDRRPKILYEGHLFFQSTKGKFPVSDINTPETCQYLGGAKEYDRLSRAMALDRTTALRCCSWGLGQVLGENHPLSGYPDVDSMVADMCESEDAQLMAVCRFIAAKKLDAALRAHDWTAFAKVYNGPCYTKYSYDTRLLQNYQKFAVGSLPDLDLRAAQLILSFLDYLPISGVDGYKGLHTEAAIRQFQTKAGLPSDGNLNSATADAFETALKNIPAPSAASVST